MSELLSHPVPAAIVLLGVLVLVHEAGHFLVGRLCGIAVETFSIGFGPKILAIQRGVTEFRLSWIPLGGYVKFFGVSPIEEIPADAKGREYYRATPLKRALVISAGPAANFILAVLAYAFLGLGGISHPPPQIGDVIEGSPAQAGGILPGDRVKSIDGQAVETWRHIEKAISESPGKPLTMVVSRNGSELSLTVTPASVDGTNIVGRSVQIGRAGIALGFLPAIVSVTESESTFALAGVRSGDEVIALAFNDKVIKISSFAHLLTSLMRARQDNAHEVTLTFRRAALPPVRDPDLPQSGSESTKPQTLSAERSAVVSTDSWPMEAATPRTFGAAVGLVDAQLTVADPGLEARSVLREGDRILRWNGTAVTTIFQLHELMLPNREPTAKLTVQRGFETLDLDVPLKGYETQLPAGKVTIFALSGTFFGQSQEPAPVVERYEGGLAALGYGMQETAKQTGVLFKTITHLFTGDIPLKALGGPIMIAKVAGDSAKMGWQTFLASMALISINLGLINLFPIPVLDGGQLLLVAVEALRRRPLAEIAIENFQKVGFVMILALVVLATYNDFSRFWKSMLEGVVGLFQ